MVAILYSTENVNLFSSAPKFETRKGGITMYSRKANPLTTGPLGRFLAVCCCTYFRISVMNLYTSAKSLPGVQAQQPRNHWYKRDVEAIPNKTEGGFRQSKWNRLYS